MQSQQQQQQEQQRKFQVEQLSPRGQVYSKERMLAAFAVTSIKDLFAKQSDITNLFFDHASFFVAQSVPPESILNRRNPESQSQNRSQSKEKSNPAVNGLLSQDSLNAFVRADKDSSSPFSRPSFSNDARRHQKNKQSFESQLSHSQYKLSQQKESKNWNFFANRRSEDEKNHRTYFNTTSNNNNNCNTKAAEENRVEEDSTSSGCGGTRKPSLVPFSSSCVMNSAQLGERSWRYIDEEGEIQGPFTSIEMDNWYMKDYFDLSLLVAFRSTHKTLFFPLEKLLCPPKRRPVEVARFLETEKVHFSKRSVSSGDQSSLASTSSSTNSSSGSGIGRGSGSKRTTLFQMPPTAMEVANAMTMMMLMATTNPAASAAEDDQQLGSSPTAEYFAEERKAEGFSVGVEVKKEIMDKRNEHINDVESSDDGFNNSDNDDEGEFDDVQGDPNIQSILNCIGLGAKSA